MEEKWSAVRSALVNTAEEVLGEAGRTQPDWFRESLGGLKPLITARNAAYIRWVRSGRQGDLSRLREARTTARSEESHQEGKECVVPGEG